MKDVAKSPWFAVSMALVGLIAGYSFVIVQHGEAAGPDECLYDPAGKAVHQTN